MRFDKRMRLFSSILYTIGTVSNSLLKYIFKTYILLGGNKIVFVFKKYTKCRETILLIEYNIYLFILFNLEIKIP